MSVSSSEGSEAESTSPGQSPDASRHDFERPTLDRLVLHFVSAKKSLEAATHVSRADELVTHSRHLVEELAVLTARNAYAYRGLQDQVDVLRAVRVSIQDDADAISDDFSRNVLSLDIAHRRLEKTLESLRGTILNSRLHTTQTEIKAATDIDADAEPPVEDRAKALIDFVDESSHEVILSSLRTLIDSFHHARADLDRSLSSFGAAITEIDAVFTAENLDDEPFDHIQTLYDKPDSPLEWHFRRLEEHAGELASLLHNLISHYDLCVTALKHTEGGGEAAKAAMLANDDAPNSNSTDPEESLYRRTVPEPMDDDERTEMLTVLEKDAQEVEDVAGEIRDRHTEMEQDYHQISRLTHRARRSNDGLKRVLEILHNTRLAIPVHFDAVQMFRIKWQEIQVDMQTRTEELSELSGFYEQFLVGYQKLLQEIDRRAASEAQIRKFADKARKEMDRLFEADRRAREEFMDDVGAFLPSNIWHGLNTPAPRWELKTI